MTQANIHRKVRIPPMKPGGFGETLWALPIAKSLYQLANIPMVAYGYAEGDIVYCEEVEGVMQVVYMHKDSSNGTIRLQFVNSSAPSADSILNELVSIGCTYEKFHNNIVGVTVPPTTEVSFIRISDFLNDTPDDVLIGWEVGKWLQQNKPRSEE